MLYFNFAQKPSQNNHMNYLEIFKQNENLARVPDQDLNWLLASGEIIQVKRVDFIFPPNQPANHFMFIFSGGFRT